MNGFTTVPIHGDVFTSYLSISVGSPLHNGIGASVFGVGGLGAVVRDRSASISLRCHGAANKGRKVARRKVTSE